MRAAVVGCHGIGRTHARAIAESRQVELAAVCDIDPRWARELADKYEGVAVHTDFARMLADVRPDIVALAVPTSAHAELAIRAAEEGVKGIVGEKPMARDLGEARAMIAAAKKHGARLIINHQRRTYPALRKMRELIASGAVGQVHLIRGACAGDVLTDGTHLIDSIRFLAGDEDVEWVFGNVFRLPVDPDRPIGKGCVNVDGWRYRHGCPIENGAMATWQFAGGLRAEILTGELRLPGRAYQDYEVLADEGGLWRPGDQADPNLLIRTPKTDGWQAVDGCPPVEGHSAIAGSYDRLAENIRAGGGEHPLAAENGLRALEIIMAIFESARLRAKVGLPLSQERSGLEILVDEGRI